MEGAAHRNNCRIKNHQNIKVQRTVILVAKVLHVRNTQVQRTVIFVK